MKNLLQFVVATLMVIGMFSCNVIDITKKRYSIGYYISSSSSKKVEAQNNTVKENKNDFVKESKMEKLTESPSTNISKTDTPQKIPTDINVSNKMKSIHKKEYISLVQNKPVFAIKSSKLAVSLIQMEEQKLINKNLQNSRSDSDVALLLLVILAILVPPLAVFLKRGLDTMFWISLILTLCFWFPGVIFALLVVLDAI